MSNRGALNSLSSNDVPLLELLQVCLVAPSYFFLGVYGLTRLGSAHLRSGRSLRRSSGFSPSTPTRRTTGPTRACFLATYQTSTKVRAARRRGGPPTDGRAGHWSFAPNSSREVALSDWKFKKSEGSFILDVCLPSALYRLALPVRPPAARS